MAKTQLSSSFFDPTNPDELAFLKKALIEVLAAKARNISELIDSVYPGIDIDIDYLESVCKQKWPGEYQLVFDEFDVISVQFSSIGHETMWRLKYG